MSFSPSFNNADDTIGRSGFSGGSHDRVAIIGIIVNRTLRHRLQQRKRLFPEPTEQ
jgi:hypothetical protein